MWNYNYVSVLISQFRAFKTLLAWSLCTPPFTYFLHSLKQNSAPTIIIWTVSSLSRSFSPSNVRSLRSASGPCLPVPTLRRVTLRPCSPSLPQRTSYSPLLKVSNKYRYKKLLVYVHSSHLVTEELTFHLLLIERSMCYGHRLSCAFRFHNLLNIQPTKWHLRGIKTSLVSTVHLLFIDHFQMT